MKYITLDFPELGTVTVQGISQDAVEREAGFATSWYFYSITGARPLSIPSRPDLVYYKNWVSWTDWCSDEEATETPSSDWIRFMNRQWEN